MHLISTIFTTERSWQIDSLTNRYWSLTRWCTRCVLLQSAFVAICICFSCNWDSIQKGHIIMDRRQMIIALVINIYFSSYGGNKSLVLYQDARLWMLIWCDEMYQLFYALVNVCMFYLVFTKSLCTWKGWHICNLARLSFAFIMRKQYNIFKEKSLTLEPWSE